MTVSLRFWKRHWVAAVWVVATLGSASGIVAAYSSFASAIWLRTVPGHDPDALLAIGARRDTGTRLTTVSFQEYAALRSGTSAFTGVAGQAAAQGWYFRTSGGPRPVAALHVSDNFLDVLGVQPIVGRSFQREDAQRGQPIVAMLSFSAWQRFMGGVADVSGTRLPLAKAMVGWHDVQVVGVLPEHFEAFRNGAAAEVFLSLPEGLPVNIEMVGRLAPGVGALAASAQVSELLREFDKNALLGTRKADLLPLRERWFGDSSPLLWPLAAVSLFVLLTALTTSGGVLLVLFTSRSHEAAVRAALGESPRRWLSRVIGESMPIVGASVMVSIGVCQIVRTWMAAMAPTDSVKAIDAGLSLTSIALCSALTFGVVVASCVVPGWLQARNRRLLTHLHGVTTSTHSTSTQIARRTLVAGQTAVAVALVLSASVVGVSTYRLLVQPLGFEVTDVLSVRITPTDGLLEEEGAYMKLLSRLLAAATDAAPRTTAALTVDPPLGEGQDFRRVTFADGTFRQVMAKAVSPGFLEVLGIQLLGGRDISAAGSSCETLVNQSFADRFLGGREPALRRAVYLATVRCDVVGVTADVREGQLSATVQPAIYPRFTEQMARRDVYLVIKGHPTGAEAAARLTTRLQSTAPNVYLVVESLDERVVRQTSSPRFWTVGLLVLAGFALMTTCLGIAATVAQVASERRRESAIRVALGGSVSAVRWSVARISTFPVVTGAVIGLWLAWMTRPLLSPVITNSVLLSPGVFLACLAGTALVAGGAALFGARSGSPMDIVKELRNS